MPGVQSAVPSRPLRSEPPILVHGAREIAAGPSIRQATNLTASRREVPAQQQAQLQHTAALPVHRCCTGYTGHLRACGTTCCLGLSSHLRGDERRMCQAELPAGTRNVPVEG